MCHYDTPLYLEEVLGGWTNRQLVDAFEKYAKVIFEEYKRTGQILAYIQ